MKISFHSRTTFVSFLILNVNVFITLIKYGVDAQLYRDQDCRTDSTTGTTIETCFVNRPSPLTYTATDGTVITIDVAVILVSCIASVPGTISNCVCDFVVNPSSPINETDTCNTCSILEISDTVFEHYFDCSNRLTGSCVGLTATGECISNVPISTPGTGPTSTTLAPSPLPGVPTFSPVTNSIRSPIFTPSSDQEGYSNNLTIEIVVAIGVVGGMVLSALVAYLLVLRNRKKQIGKKTNAVPPEPIVSTGKQHTKSNVNGNDTSTQSSATTVRKSTAKTPSTNDHVSQSDPHTGMPDKPKKRKSTSTMRTQQSSTSGSASAPHRPSYPVNPDLHVKDQCRMVPPRVPMVPSVPMVSPVPMVPPRVPMVKTVPMVSPVLVSTRDDSKVIPIAVAVGVSMVSSSQSSEPVSSRRSNNETHRRPMLEP